MTRKFYHGRTETMRPCTEEAVYWCKAMMDPNCDVSVCIVESLYCSKTTQVKEMEAVFESLTWEIKILLSDYCQEESNAAGL